MPRPYTCQRLACCAAILAILSGCTGTPRSREETATPPSAKGDVYYGTELALGDCVMKRGQESPLLAIGGALITSAVTQGVSRIGTAIKESAKPHTSEVLAERNVQLTDSGLAAHPCIQIVRGWFYRDPGYDPKRPFNEQPKLLEATARLQDSFLRPDQLEWLWGNGLWLAGPPDFVFEGVLGQAAGDKTARFVYPLFLRMEEPAESRTLRPDKTRNIMILLGFEGTESALDVGKAPGATLVIGRTEPGKAHEFPAADRLPPRVFKVCTEDTATTTPAATATAGSSGFPAPSVGGAAAGPATACAATIDAVATPFESDWFKLQLGTAPAPLRVKALVTETQGGSEFLAFVGDVFAGAQGTITSELDALVNPVTRAKREAEELQTRDTAESTLDTNLAGAIKSLQSCAAGTGDLPDLASKARKAMRDYDAARRALRDGPTFGNSDFDAIPIGGTAAEIKAGCKKALNKLAG